MSKLTKVAVFIGCMLVAAFAAIGVNSVLASHTNSAAPAGADAGAISAGCVINDNMGAYGDYFISYIPGNGGAPSTCQEGLEKMTKAAKAGLGAISVTLASQPPMDATMVCDPGNGALIIRATESTSVGAASICG